MLDDKMKESLLQSIGNTLWNLPNEANWEKFSRTLRKSKAKYYKVFYGKGKLGKADDLKSSSYIGIYDRSSKLIVRIPVYKLEGRKIRGATIYIKGLAYLAG